MTSNTDGAAQGETCSHDSRFLTVTGRERTGNDITWAIVTCRCGKLWQLADHRKAQAADVLEQRTPGSAATEEEKRP